MSVKVSPFKVSSSNFYIRLNKDLSISEWNRVLRAIATALDKKKLKGDISLDLTGDVNTFGNK